MSIYTLSNYTNEQILNILDLAQAFKDGKKVDYQGEKVVANLFFEPSSRTHYSFEMAAMKLNCKTMNFEASNSSVLKGETLYDTVKLFESIGCDALIVRHPRENYYNDFYGEIKVPIINAGDGSGNHVSQSLLDLLTIIQEFKKFEGLKIVIVGDIVHSRVAHTNIEVMKRLGMKVYASGPSEFKEEGVEYVELDDVIEEVDIVMLLRIQHERHKFKMNLSKEEYNGIYGLNSERVYKMKANAIIMHPAPFNRNVEITDEVVECDKSRIFKQMENGVYVRMALLHRVLNDENII